MSEVVNNKALHRYELAVEGYVAATYYKLADGVITFVHTEVPPELGGKGIGSKLIKGALDQVRAMA
jgi:predicted GNAT family acetyltransferase